MTEKVVLTQEQFEAIEAAKKTWGNNEVFRLHVDKTVDKTRTWFNEAYAHMNGISIENMAKILFVPDSFKVESKYEVGDWKVYGMYPENIGQIIGRDSNNPNIILMKVQDKAFYNHTFNLKTESFFKSELRDATPKEIKAEKERRVWAKIGRKVGDFRAGDIGIEKIGEEWQRISNYDGNLLIKYNNGQLKGFYPAESLIRFENGEES